MFNITPLLQTISVCDVFETRSPKSESQWSNLRLCFGQPGQPRLRTGTTEFRTTRKKALEGDVGLLQESLWLRSLLRVGVQCKTDPPPPLDKDGRGLSAFHSFLSLCVQILICLAYVSFLVISGSSLNHYYLRWNRYSRWNLKADFVVF